MSFRVKNIKKSKIKRLFLSYFLKIPYYFLVVLKNIFTRKKYFTPIFLLLLTISLLFFIKNSSTGKDIIKEAVFSLGSELPKDKDGFTNFLVMGHGGGESHATKGHKLTDSIMIVSLDETSRNVVLLSIPRDFFVELGKDFFDKTGRNGTRINSIVRDWSNVFFKELIREKEHKENLSLLSGQEKKEYEWKLDAIATERAQKIMIEKISEIFEIDIHRFVKIDFKGFEKIIDIVGGVDIVVEKSIYDPCYPDYEWGYDKLFLEANSEPQHLDSKNTLKYARSRHNFYDSGLFNKSCQWSKDNLWNKSSDFDRSKRQQKVIKALKEKVSSSSFLLSPKSIKDALELVRENYSSDLSFGEMITLANIGSKMDKNNISTFNLNDDPAATGGFLVTPDRKLYGGAFVLVPFLNLEKNKYAQIRSFKKVIFNYRDISNINPVKINIFNTTKISGLALDFKKSFERYGFSIGEVGNSDKEYIKNTLEYSDTAKFNYAVGLIKHFVDMDLIKVEDENVFDFYIGKKYKKLNRVPQI